MKIIIIGAGKVGVTLAEHLSGEGHEITVVDADPEALRGVGERLDVMTVEGNRRVVTQTPDGGGR